MRRSSKFQKRIGLLKSIAIYYWKPFNRRRLKAFYEQFVKQGDLCFDIGAHVGNRTDAWLSLGAKVIAIEPQPECVKYLHRRFKGNSLVQIVDQAVGANPGETILHISSANPTISTTSGDLWRKQIRQDARYPIQWDEQVCVRVTTLDELITRFGVPAFCKIDVENAEFEVLSGLNQPLTQISFEYYPPAMQNTYSCIARIHALGDYAFNWSFGESLRLESQNWLNAEELRTVLQGFRTRHQYGDIYARLAGK